MNTKKLFFRASLAALVMGFAVMATQMGCVGYVDGGGDAVAVVGVPDVAIFGGGGYYDRGADVHVYSQRGSVSRAAAHPSGGGGGGHGDKR